MSRFLVLTLILVATLLARAVLWCVEVFGLSILNSDGAFFAIWGLMTVLLIVLLWRPASAFDDWLARMMDW